MEEKLRALFDYQRFAQNADLQTIIDTAHGQPATRQSLSDDDVEYVAAAKGILETALKRFEAWRDSHDTA